MIAHITGTVVSKNLGSVVIDVGGLGYLVSTPNDTLAELTAGEAATLSTHLAVKEDALDLYGFSTDEAKEFFKMLIGISGIGPRGALGILNLAPLSTLRNAIHSGDSAYLTKVSGVGKKTAEKLVLELKDKVIISGDEETEQTPGGDYKGESETLSALEALGYTAREAREAIAEIPASAETSNEKIREALKYLGKK